MYVTLSLVLLFVLAMIRGSLGKDAKSLTEYASYHLDKRVLPCLF